MLSTLWSLPGVGVHALQYLDLRGQCCSRRVCTTLLSVCDDPAAWSYVVLQLPDDVLALKVNRVIQNVRFIRGHDTEVPAYLVPESVVAGQALRLYNQDLHDEGEMDDDSDEDAMPALDENHWRRLVCSDDASREEPTCPVECAIIKTLRDEKVVGGVTVVQLLTWMSFPSLQELLLPVDISGSACWAPPYQPDEDDLSMRLPRLWPSLTSLNVGECRNTDDLYAAGSACFFFPHLRSLTHSSNTCNGQSCLPDVMRKYPNLEVLRGHLVMETLFTSANTSDAGLSPVYPMLRELAARSFAVHVPEMQQRRLDWPDVWRNTAHMAPNLESLSISLRNWVQHGAHQLSPASIGLHDLSLLKNLVRLCLHSPFTATDDMPIMLHLQELCLVTRSDSMTSATMLLLATPALTKLCVNLFGDTSRQHPVALAARTDIFGLCQAIGTLDRLKHFALYSDIMRMSPVRSSLCSEVRQVRTQSLVQNSLVTFMLTTLAEMANVSASPRSVVLAAAEHDLPAIGLLSLSAFFQRVNKFTLYGYATSGSSSNRNMRYVAKPMSRDVVVQLALRSLCFETSALSTFLRHLHPLVHLPDQIRWMSLSEGEVCASYPVVLWEPHKDEAFYLVDAPQPMYCSRLSPFPPGVRCCGDWESPRADLYMEVTHDVLQSRLAARECA